MRTPWGWAGSVEEFLRLPVDPWLASVTAHHRALLNLGVAGMQEAAWSEEHSVVQAALRELCDAQPAAPGWGLVFEYELPLEGGRRPDVVLLAGGSIVVMEFKSSPFPEAAQIDQVEAYARDLADYHEQSHGKRVIPILVLPRARDFAATQGDFVACSSEHLSRYLYSSATEGTIDLDRWLKSPYAPLPTLVQAARRIFEHEPLPHVKRAISAGIPEAIDLLARLVEAAAEEQRRLMVFITGVPGAGKTLVGLRFVYERSDTAGTATFLSGNGPLVRVLQDALKSRVFVRDLHAYINTYALTDKVPKEKVLVFDEAQRAWDADFMQRKRGLRRSEPDMLVEVGEKISDWSALIGLVGEGQEIHSGEEGGIAQWARAIEIHDAPTWSVHCPTKLEDDFAPLAVHTHDALDLDVSLRTRRAENLHEWVRLVLQGSFGLAARLAMRIQEQAYPMWVTRELADARIYALQRYIGEGPDRRYGLVASSHAKNLKALGFDISWLSMRKMKVEKWFNAPPDDPLSCCALSQPATEFQVQGLELDLPIILWGNDFLWTGEAWRSTPIRRQHALEDPEQILKNVYRVLLTRGRDGLVAVVSDQSIFDATEHALLAAGLKPLPEPQAKAA